MNHSLQHSAEAGVKQCAFTRERAGLIHSQHEAPPKAASVPALHVPWPSDSVVASGQLVFLHGGSAYTGKRLHEQGRSGILFYDSTSEITQRPLCCTLWVKARTVQLGFKGRGIRLHLSVGGWQGRIAEEPLGRGMLLQPS